MLPAAPQHNVLYNSLSHLMPFQSVNQFFDELPQNVMLIATAVAICGVAYAIFHLSIYLFLQNGILAVACYHGYKQLAEMSSLQQNIYRLEDSNRDLERINTELNQHEVNIGTGIVRLGNLQGQLERLREQVASESQRLATANEQYARLNTQMGSLHVSYNQLYHRWERLTDRRES